MPARIRNVPVVLLATFCLLLVLLFSVFCFLFSSSIADAIRAVTGDAPRLVLRPEEVPACGPAWRMAGVPNPSSEYNELRAAAAASPRDVWAVGTQGNEESARTLVQRWDGTRWSVVPSPSVRQYSNHLYGVAIPPAGAAPRYALSPDDAWAVGGYHREAGYWQTLTLHWDGQEWTQVPSPSPAQISILNAVSAAASDDVWAVGEYSAGSQGVGAQPLALHWDGSAWSVAPVPGGGQSAALNAVVALAPGDVWAAGFSAGPSDADAPFFTHWDGRAWSAVQPGGSGTIWGLAAVSREEVWAVGNDGPRSLIMRWDGAGWRAMPSPNPGSTSNTLSAAAAVAPDDVWAVGSHSSGGADKTLTMHWDGTRWTPVPSPSAADFMDALWGLAALGSRDIWAVGSYITDPAGTNLALVERYSNPCGE